jgi:hypothetical protein
MDSYIPRLAKVKDLGSKGHDGFENLVLPRWQEPGIVSCGGHTYYLCGNG